MDIGGLGSFVLELSKTVLDAKKNYQKKHDQKAYIEVLEMSFDELKIKYQELEQENLKLQKIIDKENEFHINKNHYKILQQFNIQNYSCDNSKMHELISTDKHLELALYELYDQHLIYHLEDECDYYILEYMRAKALRLMVDFENKENAQ